MDVCSAILKRRSIRRFKQKKISLEILKEIVNAARLAPSARNLQPLEYIIINDDALLEKTFSCLKWAGYIEDGAPPEGQKPVAYIAVVANKKINERYERDVGAAVENMILYALGKGIGSCFIRAIDFDRLSEILKIPNNLTLDCVLALGYPDEEPVIEESGEIKYYKDKNGVLHVPKRRLEDILHINYY
jgi:nitroreductase